MPEHYWVPKLPSGEYVACSHQPVKETVQAAWFLTPLQCQEFIRSIAAKAKPVRVDADGNVVKEVDHG